MKIYILDACHPAGIELAKKFCDVVCWPDPEIANWPENADGVMVRMTPITSDELKRADHVKVICKQGVGFETIDIDAAKKYGIPILRTPGINSEAVAEMAFALSLSVTILEIVATFLPLLGVRGVDFSSLNNFSLSFLE